jgi:hypothetical protein
MEAVAIAPFVLGPVKRKIGLHHQVLRPCRLRGIERDADARGDADLVAVDGERLAEHLADPPRELADDVWIGQAEHQNGELVATEARHEMIWPHGFPETLDDLLQQEIAHGMPKGVVDILEVVDVEIEHGERRSPAQARIEGHRQPLHEGAAIGEIGEKIRLRQFENLAVGGFEPQRMA